MDVAPIRLSVTPYCYSPTVTSYEMGVGDVSSFLRRLCNPPFSLWIVYSSQSSELVLNPVHFHLGMRFMTQSSAARFLGKSHSFTSSGMPVIFLCPELFVSSSRVLDVKRFTELVLSTQTQGRLFYQQYREYCIAIF